MTIEQLKNIPEAQPPSIDDSPWGKKYQESAPPFKGGEQMEVKQNDKNRLRDLEQIHDCEIDMVAENPDVLGYNIDSKYIVWPKRYTEAKEVENTCKRADGTYDDAELARVAKKYSEELGEEIASERIKEVIEEELSKDKLLDDTLSKLPEGVKFRITPHAPQSVFSVANSEKIVNKNGESRYHIDDYVMAQVRKIREKAARSELTVVMNQLHEGKDGKLTSNIPEHSADYIALCQSFVEQSGYSEQAGKGLVLELGNECNMSHESDGPLFKSEAFAETVDAEAYANFYFETAKALKATFPDIKLSLTGTAFYDYDFIKHAVDIIQAKKDADESLKETTLIDVISFHPYRHTVESPAPFISNGKTLGESEVRERSKEYWGTLDEDKKDAIRQEVLAKLTEDEKTVASVFTEEELEDSIAYRVYANFDQQLESLRALADQIGAEVTVGEISFYAEDQEWGESIDENEQERNAAYGREKGYTSLLWPGEQIVKHENPERRKVHEDS